MEIFRFINKVFYIGSLFLSNLVSTTALSCILMSNQACKSRPEIINVNSNNPVFYLFSIKTRKCSGTCNNIYTCPKICVPDDEKDLNVKVFNLISRTNETRHIKWNVTCICRLDAIVCNNKQRWNNNKCRYECKQLIAKGICDKGYNWNCQCECDKSCDIGEYLDYGNCKCRKILVDKLVDECTETIEERSLVIINSTNCKHTIWILYIVLFSIFFTTNVRIAAYFVYYKYMNHNKENVSIYDYVYQPKNY